MEIEEVIAKIRRIGSLVKNLSRRLDRPRGKQRGTHPDLTFSQARTIWLLDEVESHTMSELAALCSVSRPAATSNVDTLEKLGVIERFADPSDRRVVRIRLTEKGKKWHREHRRHHKQRMARLLQKLSPQERKELASSLEKMYNILSRIDPLPRNSS